MHQNSYGSSLNKVHETKSSTNLCEEKSLWHAGTDNIQEHHTWLYLANPAKGLQSGICFMQELCRLKKCTFPIHCLFKVDPHNTNSIQKLETLSLLDSYMKQAFSPVVIGAVSSDWGEIRWTVNLNCHLHYLYFTISLAYCCNFIHVMEQQHTPLWTHDPSEHLGVWSEF